MGQIEKNERDGRSSVMYRFSGLHLFSVPSFAFPFVYYALYNM